ncbi:D-alanine--D-alanine ligase [Shewanella intestini]|uniref:D-alanine--D-alanine ligase n=1 Tax=Shewanella intestini TaxID=2017544 RepID=A0ABS5I5D3_9GAMM|nr:MULTISPECIES: D-alanine--D-alanine ligase [Shewanella]MBR9729238.1 D-alanine--D-alanine ligase [Shewanella intestini]MRG35383.1 D-alanine--D-alanine ligase [Shewanella sp. XMDDZSB0408]
MAKINVLLLCGGGGAEHDISLMSARFFTATLAQLPQFEVLKVELNKQGQYITEQGEHCEITHERQIRYHNSEIPSWEIDFALPCIHGYPGETGDIQSFFDLIKLPYFGCDAEASRNCFNKVTAKMWFSALGIPNTPYLFLHQFDQQAVANTQGALDKWGSVFIKAASQGSSVGCYKIDTSEDIASTLEQAFSYSPYVVVEKTIVARELEVAVYEYQGHVIATKPGEIICADNAFYTFDEKYADNSQTRTDVEARNLTHDQIEQIQAYSIKVFKGMKLRHLSRIDFFLTDEGEVLLNEINTFPGSTPISMFPKMMQHNGLSYADFLVDAISSQCQPRR